ncbi:MAG: type II secretion system F family protein [candidate division WOR-3 bacterium]
MEFSYFGINERGEKVKGFLIADSLEDAVKILKGQGIKPVEVKRFPFSFLRRKARVKKKDLILFTMQFQSIITSGVPITVGLESLKDEASSKELKAVIEEIRLSLLQGNSIYGAFSRFKDVFPPYYLGALKVGEESGTLPKTLERIIKVMEREEEQKSKTIRALIYPAFAVSTILIAALFYIFYVLPKVLDLIKNIGTKLPFITVLLISFVNFIRKFAPVILLILVLSVIVVAIAYRFDNYREKIEAFTLKRLGIISGILIKSFYAQFTTFLALMLEAGVDMSTSLELLTFSTGSIYLKNLIVKIRELVSAGQSLGQSFRKVDFPPLMCSIVSIGEETGTLPNQLNNLSKYYETELSRTVERLQAVIEPVLIIIIGIFAALIFVSVLLPIYESIGSIR